jgi:hypothetical protein
MKNRIKFTKEEELEIKATICPQQLSISASLFYDGSPEYPASVEDLYVGVIIKGTSIDITKLLNKRQLDSIKEECLQEYDDRLFYQIEMENDCE